VIFKVDGQNFVPKLTYQDQNGSSLNPHNPSGTIFSKDDCFNYSIVLKKTRYNWSLSDESIRALVLMVNRMKVLSKYERSPPQTLYVGSFEKHFISQIGKWGLWGSLPIMHNFFRKRINSMFF